MFQINTLEMRVNRTFFVNIKLLLTRKNLVDYTSSHSLPVSTLLLNAAFLLLQFFLFL